VKLPPRCKVLVSGKPVIKSIIGVKVIVNMSACAAHDSRLKSKRFLIVVVASLLARFCTTG
jgi:hypothetical protein